jgi:phosphotransferase system IIA component
VLGLKVAQAEEGDGDGVALAARDCDGVALVEPGFGQVTAIVPLDDHTIAIKGEHGAEVHAKIDWREFLG